MQIYGIIRNYSTFVLSGKMCIFVPTNLKDMNKILYIIAAAAVLLAAGCQKEKVNPAMPSVVWESNPSFGTVELTQSLDAVVTVSAPGKFQDLKLVMNLGSFNILANPYIAISSNKGGTANPVLDLMADPSSVAFAKTLGMNVGQSLRDKLEIKLDLRAILETILLGQVVENNSTFTFDVRITDQAGRTVSKTAKIHYTAAPEISWPKNTRFEVVDLDAQEVDCKVSVWAPGKIEKLLVTLGEAAAPSLKNYVKNRTTDGAKATGEYVIDLVNDSKVAESFKDWFPAGQAASGKEQVNLDFGFLFQLKYDMEPSTNIFMIFVEDKNGKTTQQAVQFKKN